MHANGTRLYRNLGWHSQVGLRSLIPCCIALIKVLTGHALDIITDSYLDFFSHVDASKIETQQINQRQEQITQFYRNHSSLH